MNDAEMKKKLHAHLYAAAIEKGAAPAEAERMAAALVASADAPQWPPGMQDRLREVRQNLYEQARARGLDEDDSRRVADLLVSAALMQVMRPPPAEA